VRKQVAGAEEQIKLSEGSTKISHDDVPPPFILFKRLQTPQTVPTPSSQLLHLPPAIKTVIMASEETIPIIVEFT
jgi:hypothetical protein